MDDILIIGAGAAGLMAGKILAEADKNNLLEARDRVGGRIHSFSDVGNNEYEGGAEFVHGNLETTLDLLCEAKIGKFALTGEMWQVKNGKWCQENEFFTHAERVITSLKGLRDDVSMEMLLQDNFNGEAHEELRRSVTSYIEGYYSGEVSKMSAKSFLAEWLSEDDQQYRPEGGYSRMVKFLVEYINSAGGSILCSTPVKKVNWNKNKVEIIDASGKSYYANKLIVTVPLGVWTANENEVGAISYLPAIPEKLRLQNKWALVRL